MISVPEARERLTGELRRSGQTSRTVSEAAGLVVCSDIRSPIDVPAFDNSAMDGYAVAFDGSRDRWDVVTEIPAGSSSAYPVKEGEAARIYTGSPMPPGADTVIPQELAERNGNTVFLLSNRIEKAANVRYTGSQVKAGGLVMKAGTVLTPGGVGLLSSIGLAGVPVYAPPVVSVIVTGSELREAGSPLEPGAIYNSNGPMLQAALSVLGISTCHTGRARDDEAQLRQLIEKELDRSDVVIISGGISVGDYDFVKTSLALLGVNELFYQVRQRPGKPMYAGKSGEKWVFALPGNPASVLTCFNQFVKPCLKFMMGHDRVWLPDLILPLTADCPKKEGLTFFMKAIRENGQVSLLSGQQSFNLAAFAQADCLVELAEETGFIAAETPVNVFLL
ncbi:MAG: gephyrin-like molybdotransferase Glp [Prolixibacteraceae bacterium]